MNNPGTHNLRARMTHRWNHLGVSKKFTLAFTLLFFFLLLISLTAYSCFVIIHLAEKKILLSNDLKEDVLEVDRGMQRARRLLDDFFLSYQRLGLQKAHERYAQPSVRQISQVIRLSRDLKKDFTEVPLSDILGRVRTTDLNLYLASARRFARTSIEAVQLITRRAAPGHGLEDRIQLIDRKTNRLLKGHVSLLNSHMQANAHYGEYLAGRRRSTMQSVFNAHVQLRDKLERDPGVPVGEKEKIAALLAENHRLEKELLAIDGQLAEKMHDFALQEQVVAPVSRTLLSATDEAVREARRQIDLVYAVAGIVIPSMGIFCLLAMLALARLLHRSVTENILELAEAARSFGRENLEVRAPESARDELGELARVFNRMAAHIQDLIENLEHKVARRTAELARSEERFRLLFEDLPRIAVQGYDQERTVLYWNRASEALYGYSAAEVVGRKLEELIIPPAMRDEVRQRIADWYDKGIAIPSGEHVLCHRDGGEVPVYSSHVMLESSHGERIMFCVDIDLAELKRAQAQARQLQRARKMEAIGLMAGGVAHDLNNILSGIIGYPELLLLQLPEESELREPIKAIHESGKRAAAVVADLLTVARGVAGTRTPAALNTLVREYLSSPEYIDLDGRYPQVACREDLADGLPDISCSPVHIKKCLMNLVMNAFEAIESTGTVTLTTSCFLPDRAWVTEHGGEQGNYVLLTVADTGSGISAENIEHIFEPFYSKKVLGRSGTGLGLAVVWNTIQEHGGVVTVSSSARGSVFSLYLPAVEGEGQGQAQDVLEEAHVPRGNGERILVVDDEAHLLDIASRMLSHLGYEVVCKGSGEEAVAWLQDREVDLVLLDMVMEPGMNGRQTFEQIVRLHPGQKALIASGFSENEEVQAALAAGAGGFMKKPYTMEKLARMVQKVLGG